MKPRFAPALLLFPALLHAQDQPEPSPVALIEQTVIAREAETSAAAMRDLAMALHHAANPEEKQRLQTSIGKYSVWLRELDSQLHRTGSVSEDAAETLSECASAINDVAWHIAILPDFSAMPHEVPRSLAELAVKWNAADSDDHPAMLDTYARTLALSGSMDQAATQQQAAVNASQDDPDRIEAFQATLDSYRKGVIPPAKDTGDWADEETPTEAPSEASVEVETEIANENDDQAERLNTIAWSMVTSQLRMPEAALPVAVAALDHCKPGLQQARVMDTCARALFMNGKEDAAVKLQEKALGSLLAAGSEDDDDQAKTLRDSLVRTLDSYRQGVLPEPDALELAKLADYRQDAAHLNEYAWDLVTGDEVKKDSAKTATGLASAALAWNEDDNALRPAILDTLARAQFLDGKHDEALATQKQAVASARDKSEDEGWLKIFMAHLAHYEKGELPGVGDE